MKKKDFLSLLDFSRSELDSVIKRSSEFRQMHENKVVYQPLIGKTAAIILQMESTRTRVGFEAGLSQLGVHPIFLSTKDTQLGRGEPMSDLGKVLSEMVDLIVIRTPKQEDVQLLADSSSIPVINAMTTLLHPCQLLADMQTFQELRGPITNKKVTFVGDGHNMCHSYINASRQWDFNLTVCCPEGFEPNKDILEKETRPRLERIPKEAVSGADLVVTDVWSSMGHEGSETERNKTFKPYQITESLLDLANENALFMHCLPAHRGEEVNETILDDERSVVWREAGNRLHSQKALVEFMLKESIAEP
jgi:ornithine carbamoyltransferase